MKRVIRYFVCGMLCPVLGMAQELKGEVLLVTTGSSSTIWFPADIKNIDPSCDESVFSVKKDGRRIKITPMAAQETAPKNCRLVVQEGSGDDIRIHSFKISFLAPDAELDMDKAFIDIHTMEKLQERVNRQKTGGNTVAAATEPAIAADPSPAPDQQPVQQHNSSNSSQDYLEIDGQRIPRSQIDRQVRERMDVFRQNLEIIGNKSDPRHNPVNRVIDHTMKYFNNDRSRKVDVRNGNNPVVVRSIYDYLTRMASLPFKRVKIEYSNLQFIGKFEKNADGSWWGTVCFVQRFTGVREGQPYTDVSRKHVKVQVKVTEFVTDAGKQKNVEVFLGDIGMSEGQL